MDQTWKGITRHFESCEDMTEAWDGGHYLVGHPHITELEGKLTARYNMPTAVTNRGMTAILTTVLALGRTVACSNQVYPGTKIQLEEWARDGKIQITWFDPTDIASLHRAINALSPSVVLAETIGNSPHMPVANIDHLLNAITDSQHPVVDSTLTPLWKPPHHKKLVVVGSLSKYDQPRHDYMGGYISAPAETLQRVRSSRFYGNVAMLPVVAQQYSICLKQTPRKYQQHSRHAKRIAAACNCHDAVQHAWHPGLNSHPQHEIAAEQLGESLGGLLYIQLKSGEKAAIQVCDYLASKSQRDWTIAASFGSNNWSVLPFIGKFAAYVGQQGIVRIAPGRNNAHLNTAALKKALDSLL
jgi:methionine-gamma-lyase